MFEKTDRKYNVGYQAGNVFTYTKLTAIWFWGVVGSCDVVRLLENIIFIYYIKYYIYIFFFLFFYNFFIEMYLIEPPSFYSYILLNICHCCMVAPFWKYYIFVSYIFCSFNSFYFMKYIWLVSIFVHRYLFNVFFVMVVDTFKKRLFYLFFYHFFINYIYTPPNLFLIIYLIYSVALLCGCYIY